MQVVPHNLEGYNLLHNGSLAFAEMERNGFNIDREYLSEAIRRVDARAAYLAGEMRKTDMYKLWRRVFGQSLNLSSKNQLGELLFKKMGYIPVAFTKTGRPKTDAAALSHIKDQPLLEYYAEAEKLKKLSGTFLSGIQNNISPDGRLRAFFNLNLAATYRSSSQDPNGQNMPIRDPLQGKIIRRAFIPSEGHRLVEIDYSSVEVRVAAAYHRDPQMLTYLTDPNSDMHRDTAADVFMLSPDKITKKMRHIGKTVVFASFFGDYYVGLAKQAWTMMMRDTPELIDHLKTCGIMGLGDCDPQKPPAPATFEKHMQKVENQMWEERFPVYNQWRKDRYRDYCNNGWFNNFTGFTFSGVLRRNVVINSPVQSSAFHCTLRSIIRLTELLRGTGAKIVSTIHDSIILDVPECGFDDIIELCLYTMTTELKREWTWLDGIPIDAEPEACEVGESWYDKKEI